jgi:uncharacterized protein (TIGR03382 family)
MNIRVMRRLDTWAGVPICVALGGVEAVVALFRRRRPPFNPGKARRVLVMKFIGLGTIAEAAPMFRAMRRFYPEAEISFLTFEWCEGLVRLLGFDSVRVIRTSSFFRFVIDSLSAAWWGRGMRFDIAHDLESVSRFSYIMSYLIHAPVRIGFFVRMRKSIRLLTDPIPFDPDNHVLGTFLSQINMDERMLKLQDSAAPQLPPEADREADELLRQAGLWGAPKLVAVNVNTGELSELRMWSLAYHSVLATKLHASHRAAIAFVGSEADKGRVDEVIRALPAGVRAANLAGLTRVDILLAILRKASLLVSNDSGPLHLASLMGTPTVGFFGASSARVYGPRSGKSINIDKPSVCQPCLNVNNFRNYACPNGMKCMRDISPEEALEAVGKLLGEPVEQG